MGYYYALDAQEESSVALAIREHYSPIGPTDACPSSPVSVAIALADKIDSLIGLFSVNEKPTGSKDPYALRRAALGVIRIILENNLRIPLRLLLEKSIAKYPKSLFKIESAPRGLLRVTKKENRPKENKRNIVEELLLFFADRLKVVLKDQHIRPDVIQAVFDNGNEDDLTRLVDRARALNEFIATNDGINLHAAYKRATNIVLAEEKKDKTQYKNLPDNNLFESEAERELFKLFTNAKISIARYLKADRFEDIMKELALFRHPIDNFLENTVVNAKDNNVRINRLLLLAQFRCLLSEVADFNKIGGQ
jgi:glycyl-tRNA synthetase beta chain